MKKLYIYGMVSALAGILLSVIVYVFFFGKIESDLIKVFVTWAPGLIGGIIGMCFIVKASDVASEKEKEKKEHEKKNG